MPFVRFSRDKRGYEHIYLFDVSDRPRSKPRILYWFRTPPGVRVGREPFDEPVKRSLEAQNPGVTFDWKKLANVTIPPPDVEHWRERRRAERAAKRVRRGDDVERGALAGDELRADDEPAGEAQASEASVEGMPGDDLPNEAVVAVGGSSVPSEKPMAVGGAGTAGAAGHRRRRRRGARRRRPTPRPDFPVAPQAASPAAELAEKNGTMAASDTLEAADMGADPSKEE